MFTVGVCSFNEEKNIENCLRSILIQKFTNLEMTEVIVISSGSTDNTNQIVEKLQQEFSKIRLIKQEIRVGKNSAINCLLCNKTTELVALVNADNILNDNNTLQKLVEPLLNNKVGVTGGHPIAMNSSNTLADFSSQMIWIYHHHIALEKTKIGELIAFRDVGI